jgi:hypothetical protein
MGNFMKSFTKNHLGDVDTIKLPDKYGNFTSPRPLRKESSSRGSFFPSSTLAFLL